MHSQLHTVRAHPYVVLIAYNNPILFRATNSIYQNTFYTTSSLQPYEVMTAFWHRRFEFLLIHQHITTRSLHLWDQGWELQWGMLRLRSLLFFFTTKILHHWDQGWGLERGREACRHVLFLLFDTHLLSLTLFDRDRQNANSIDDSIYLLPPRQYSRLAILLFLHFNTQHCCPSITAVVHFWERKSA